MEEKRRGRYVPSGTLALAALALKDVETAFGWVERAVQEHDPNLTYLIHTPYFQQLRSDPRYQDILRRMNLQS